MSTQAKDKIRYNNQDMTLKGARLPGEESGYLSPLVFLKEERGVTFNPIQANTGNYRGFTCGWEIIDNKLYLTRFSSKSFRIYTFDQFMGITPPDEENAVSLAKLFPPDEIHHYATWFSGTITAYDRRSQDEEDLNGWEFTFKEGELVEEKKRYVWSPRSLKDYIED